MSHQQLQIAPGVYITDFRANGQLVGIAEPKNQLTNDVGLLLDDCSTIQSKCKMLEYSIEEIKQEESWELDGDFREAVEDNWAVVIRLSSQMKEKVLKLYQLKYHPQNSKIQELLNIDRIQTRQNRAKHQLTKILLQRQAQLQKQQQQFQKQQSGVYL